MREMKITNDISQPILGPLEKEILELLWKKKKARVKEIHEILKDKRKVAHTSIAVMLDRLHEKKIVSREVENCRGGFRYIYFPTSEKKEYNNAILSHAVDKLIDKFGKSAVSYFNERFGQESKERK
jgi:predicted transcriptional regulator